MNLYGIPLIPVWVILKESNKKMRTDKRDFLTKAYQKSLATGSLRLGFPH